MNNAGYFTEKSRQTIDKTCKGSDQNRYDLNLKTINIIDFLKDSANQSNRYNYLNYF